MTESENTSAAIGVVTPK